MSNAEVLKIFEETGALLTGHFILRSGLHSGHFFQCARVCEHLDQVEKLATMLLDKVQDRSFTTVLSPAMGGLVIGQEVARVSKSRFIFAEKVNETLALRRNFRIFHGEKFLIVEDVITRGGRVNECIDIIRGRGGVVTGVAVLVDRSEGKADFGIPMTSLLEMSFPTYKPEEVPAELRVIPAVKPGS